MQEMKDTAALPVPLNGGARGQKERVHAFH